MESLKILQLLKLFPTEIPFNTETIPLNSLGAWAHNVDYFQNAQKLKHTRPIIQEFNVTFDQ